MESEINSIGLIELSSVATGYLVEDTMLKAGAVGLLLARTICSGKFLIVISRRCDVGGGRIARRSEAAAGASLIERRQIARVHPCSAGGHFPGRRCRPETTALDRRDRDVLGGEHH